jgi:quercetin dioxygenase-like cupin family protein
MPEPESFPDDERTFRRDMEGAGASVSQWGNAAGDRYAAHSHPYRKVLCCLAGSIVFHLPDADVELSACRSLSIDAGRVHSATVGPEGVRCVEARFDSPTRAQVT